MEKIKEIIKNKSVIIGIFVGMLVIIFLIILLSNINHKKELKCTSLNNNVTIKFNGKTPVYVEGKMTYKDIEVEDNSIGDNLSMYSNIFINNKTDRYIKYAMNYSKENASALNYVGLNYDKKMTYKQLRKNLESNNYYCK